jgi:hypothetical protein
VQYSHEHLIRAAFLPDELTLFDGVELRRRAVVEDLATVRDDDELVRE